MVNLKLKDDQYPNNGITHTRKISRAILFNEQNEVCLLKINGYDEFGLRDYYETPGGGVDENESFEEALIRELDEEVGVQARIVMFIGEVQDYYNLIYRKNVNRYYLCKVEKNTNIHHESEGDNLIEKIEFCSLEQAIEKYKAMKNHGVSKLVRERELPILLEVKRLIESKLLQL